MSMQGYIALEETVKKFTNHKGGGGGGGGGNLLWTIEASSQEDG